MYLRSIAFATFHAQPAGCFLCGRQAPFQGTRHHQFAAQRVERCSAVYLKAKLPPVSKLWMCPRSLTSWDTAAACSTSCTALPCHHTIAADLLPWRRRPPIPSPRRRSVSGTPCGACRPPVFLLSVAQPPAHELVRGGARLGGRRAARRPPPLADLRRAASMPSSCAGVPNQAAIIMAGRAADAAAPPSLQPPPALPVAAANARLRRQ